MKSFTVVLLSLSLLILGSSSSASAASYSTARDEFDKALNAAQLQDLSLDDSAASIDSAATPSMAPSDFSGLGLVNPYSNPVSQVQTRFQTTYKNLSKRQHNENHAKRISCFAFLNRRTASAKRDSDSNDIPAATECHSRTRQFKLHPFNTHNKPQSDTLPSSPSSIQQTSQSEQEHFDALIAVFNELFANSLKLHPKYIDAIELYNWRSNVGRWQRVNDLKMISELKDYIESMQLLLQRYEYDVRRQETKTPHAGSNPQSASMKQYLLNGRRRRGEKHSNLGRIEEEPKKEKRAVKEMEAEMHKQTEKMAKQHKQHTATHKSIQSLNRSKDLDNQSASNILQKKTQSWLKSLKQVSRPLRHVVRQTTATQKHEKEMLKRLQLERQKQDQADNE